MQTPEHYCTDPDAVPLDTMFKRGKGRGSRALIIGQWPAANGWRKTGKAFLTPEGEMLQSGKNPDALLEAFGLSLDDCAYTDLVKCYRGEGLRPLRSCIEGCWSLFERQLGSENFGLLILLGPPVWEVIGEKSKRRTFLRKGELVNVELSGSRYFVLPIWHTVHIYPPSSRENRQIFEENSDELRTLLTKLNFSSDL